MDELRLEALGTTCHVLGIGLERGALSRAASWIAERHDRLSRFLPASELSRFNAAAGTWAPVSHELEALLRTALWAHEHSGGLVHAGVLGSMLAIGYRRPLREGPSPSRARGAAPLPPLPEVLEVEAGRARLRRGFGVDLGGIAKGWMADRLASTLGPNCLVNLGGDLFARGPGPEGDGWPVGFAGITVLLHDQGAATSGVVRRRWLQDGEALHHLIDPRTGRPARSGVCQVSVVAGTATAAEVQAKAGLLLGPHQGAAYLAASCLAWWMEPEAL
jgi:FAD:protein FMN transferase